MSVKKNILANFAGQGWSAAMGLAFIPLYIRHLGMEAYGLIGIFGVLQSWLSILDLGMSPTLNREMARYEAGARSLQSIRDMLRSLEIICFSLAILIAIAVWSASGWLASGWLKADKLPVEVVAQALSVIALVVALRFAEGIYRGALFGLQQQVWYNGANAVLSTLRHGGAVCTLMFLSPTVEAFFFWQGLVSILTIGVFAARVHRSLPRAPRPPAFSPQAIADVWKFAGGMIGVSVLTLLLGQVDKLLLSRMLTLENFGYFILAGTVAGFIDIVQSPVVWAIYPQMVALSAKDDTPELASVYHQGAQMVTILTAPIALLLCFFSAGILTLWSGDADLAVKTAPIAAVLVFGNFLQALMNMPYRLQTAHGWTSLTLKGSGIAVLVLIPAIFWFVPRYGAVGAAWIWVALNTGFFLISIHYMHLRLLPTEKWSWYFSDVLLPTAGSAAVVLIALAFQPKSYHDRGSWVCFLLATGVSSFAASAILASRIRIRLSNIRVNRLGVEWG